MAGTERATARPTERTPRSDRRPAGPSGGKSAELAAEAVQLRHDIGSSVGHGLDGALRMRMEGRFRHPSGERSTASGTDRSYRGLERTADALASGADARSRSPAEAAAPRADFSSVRLHSDEHARSAARRLGAHAFTIGEHIYADPAHVPMREDGEHGVVAHELAHVLQQRQLGRTLLQPRLIATGTDADIQRFMALAEAAMGEQLQHDATTNEITAVASLATPATSPVFAAAMHRIMDDPTQDAEAHFGTAQVGVAVGAFPIPSDMTGSTEQQIDMDDVEAIEAGAPGNGLGKLAHELTENYQAHAAAAVAGVDRFAAAHQAGVSAESDVAEDTVGPGRRVADVDTPFVGNTFTRVQDFENYYLVFDLTNTPATGDFAVSNARQAPRVNISTRTIDHYVTGSSVVPAAGAATIAAAAADVAANPSSTVRIEGFTDTVGTAVGNVILSNQRASGVEAALTAAGVAGGRIHSVGLGQTQPVAPNNNEANRAQNRRVVVIVDRPGP